MARSQQPAAGRRNLHVHLPGEEHARHDQCDQRHGVGHLPGLDRVGGGRSSTDRTRKSLIADYRWIIEEDRTFLREPEVYDEHSAGWLPDLRAPSSPTFGTNFHTSYMPVVATGCTGTLFLRIRADHQQRASSCATWGDGICRNSGSQTGAVGSQPGFPESQQALLTSRYFRATRATTFINTNLTADCANWRE